MSESSRASSETVHGPEKPFMDEFERLGDYLDKHQVDRHLKWAVIIPWVLCVVLSIGITILWTAYGLRDQPSVGYWNAHELGMLASDRV